MPKTVSSAAHCGRGRFFRRSSNGTHTWCSVANASSISDSMPTACSTRRSVADRAA